MTLKEYLPKINKEDIYNLYEKVVARPKEYSKVTRKNMYEEIKNTYIEDPEIILKMISTEEVHILKALISENISIKRGGYIDHILFENLKNNFLILVENEEYYIPKDILNCIKMAINLYNEEIYSLKDITDSLLIGLIRVNNVLSITETLDILKMHRCIFTSKSLKDYIKTNPRLKNVINIIKYKNTYYVISLENLFYKDIISINKSEFERQKFSTEELISFGKYKINLFKKEVYEFLNYLEAHLEPIYINQIIDELIIYMGFDINDKKVLNSISDNIKELYDALIKVIPFIPIWIYNGNNLENLRNIANTPKNEN